MKRQAEKLKSTDYSQTLYAALIDAKWKLKNRKTLTDDQAARLDSINQELDHRDQDTQRRKDDAKLSAAWDQYFFDA